MKAPQIHVCILTIAFSLLCSAANACQSCLVDLAGGGILRRFKDAKSPARGHVKSTSLSSVLPIGLASKTALCPILHKLNRAGLDQSAIWFLAVRKFISLHQNEEAMATSNTQKSKPTAMARMRMKLKTTMYIDQDSDKEENEADAEEDNSKAKEEVEVMSQSMIMAIGFYKQFISPLLPPACRFLPTCSQYGVQAIKEFGPSKGVILTAWRLARCSPFGGRGKFRKSEVQHLEVLLLNISHPIF